MAPMRIPTYGLLAGVLMGTTGALFAADADIDRHAFTQLSNQTPVRSYARHGRLMSVYGREMSHGATAHASADVFLQTQVQHLFGIAPEDLRPGLMYGDGATVRGIMFDHGTGEYRKQYHNYTQVLNGVPVFESELKLLVLNNPGFPVVQANSSLHDLGNLQVGPKALQQVTEAGALAVATQELGAGAVIVEGPSPIIWAGTAAEVAAPTFGSAFLATAGVSGTADYQRYFYIIEPRTGAILYSEDKILNVDVEGNVSGWTSDGNDAGICHGVRLDPLPYVRVNIGGTAAFADVNGDFVIPNGGGGDVTVESRVWGTWFRVFNNQGADALLSQVVTPPGPANFEHNLGGGDQQLAEVNCYIHANVIRDYIKELDPGAPLDDSEFRVNVNTSGSCNAFYEGNAITFLRPGGGCPNEGYASIVYHEYGHHIVARLTGSQCAWGEGNADVANSVVADVPELAFGFFGNCNSPLRNADNNCQYDPGSCSSCGGPCHNCGRLISGCFWDLRNNMLITEPSDYRTITGQLWLASLAAHSTGTDITPLETINYLVADDDDGDIGNGTPHYDEIANAFAAHNMPPPPLNILSLSLVGDPPALISPLGNQTVQIQVEAGVEDPEPDSGILYFNDGSKGDGIFVEVPMTEIETNLYEGTFPVSLCGNQLSYYFSVDTVDESTVTLPRDAPGTSFSAVSAVDQVVAFQDDFEDDLGWTVVTTAVAGAWERDVPENCPGRGAPQEDADGSGSCYLTDNNSACNRDVNFGDTVLTSPTLDASNPEAVVSYFRWYDTSEGDNRDDPFVVEVSDDNGASWNPLETIAGDSAEAAGGWILVAYRIGDFVDNTDEFRIRFTAVDDLPVSVVEAAVDGLTVGELICEGDCLGDISGNGDVDFADILAILNAWGNLGGPEDLDMSGEVDFQDILIVLSNWGPCE